MREIKFRGKSIVTGEWCFGDLFQHGDQKFIMANNRNTEVDPETVGQYTGLKDMNSKEIYEGDMIQPYDPDDGYAVVRYDNTETEFYILFVNENVYYGLGRDFESKDLAVVGNIYDNPELVGGIENGSSVL